jgi:ribosomal subunit interface protein
MKQPLQITYLGLESSDAIDTAARAKADKLDQFHPSIMACKVTIELIAKHQQQGREFAVRIGVTVPNQELHVDRVHNEDVYIALRDAFDDMKRQLDELKEKAEDAVRRARS